MGFPRPPMPMGQGLPAHLVPPVASEDQPASKKQRTGTAGSGTGTGSIGVAALEPEDEFAAKYPAPFNLSVQVPNEPEKKDWKFHGQTLAITIGVRDSLAVVKQKLSELLGMPDKKMKINVMDGPFLNNDKTSLAQYNVGPTSVLQLAEKTRGGRK